MKAKNTSGFTLVELVVVLVMLVLLAIMLLPNISGGLLQPEVRQAANQGSQIAKALYARNLDRSEKGWPETYATNGVEGVDWSSSDKYFVDIIGGFESGVSNEYFHTIAPLEDWHQQVHRDRQQYPMEFTLLAAGGGDGATPLKGSVTDAKVRAEFLAPSPTTGRGGAHNAWCVTLGLNSSSKASIPFMFTKNLRFADDKINSLEPYDITKPDDPSSGPLNEMVDILGRKKALAVGIQGNVINFSEERFITRELFNPNKSENQFIWPAGSPEPEK